MQKNSNDYENTQTKSPDTESGHNRVAFILQRLNGLELDNNQNNDGQRQTNDNVVHGYPKACHTQDQQEYLKKVNIENVVPKLTFQCKSDTYRGMATISFVYEKNG